MAAGYEDLTSVASIAAGTNLELSQSASVLTPKVASDVSLSGSLSVTGNLYLGTISSSRIPYMGDDGYLKDYIALSYSENGQTLNAPNLNVANGTFQGSISVVGTGHARAACSRRGRGTAAPA